MGKYLYLQLKRLLRILLSALLIAAILFGCLALAYQAVVSMSEDSQIQAKIKFGVVGTSGDTFLQMGMLALNTIDSSRFSVDFIQLEEDDAQSAMRRGELAAYVVIPEGFIDAAMYGEILPVKYVSTIGAVGLVSMLKDEVTNLVEDIVVETQKGIFGTGDAMQHEGLSSGQAEYDITFKYFDFVFARSRMYSVRELGNAKEIRHLLLGHLVARAQTVAQLDQLSLSRLQAGYRLPYHPSLLSLLQLVGHRVLLVAQHVGEQ